MTTPGAAAKASDSAAVLAGVSSAGGPTTPHVWRTPSLQHAKAVQAKHQPRITLSDKTLQPHGVCTEATGRYCCRPCEWLDPFCEGTFSNLGRYGPAVSVLFKFEKWLFWTFFSMALLQLPKLLVCFAGNAIPNGNSFIASSRSILARTSLGNLGEALTTDGADEIDVPIVGRWSRHVLSLVFTSVDVASLVMFSGLMLWLWGCEHEEEAAVGHAFVTVAEFSVHIPWLPSSTTEQELREYLVHALQVHPSKITMVYDYGNIASLARQRSAVLDKIELLDGKIGNTMLRNGIKYERAISVVEQRPDEDDEDDGAMDDGAVEEDDSDEEDKPPPPHPLARAVSLNEVATSGLPAAAAKTVAMLAERRKRLLNKAHELLDKWNATKKETGALGGFVTFEHRSTVRHVLHMLSSTWCDVLRRQCFEKTSRRFRGTTVLVANPAPRPSTILWHNLGVGPLTQFILRVLTGLAAAVVFGVSVAAIYASRVYAPVYESFAPQSNTTSTTSILPEIPGKALDDALTFLAPVTVSMINTVLNKLMRYLATCERHHNATTLELSLTSRLIFRQFFNTAVLVCLVYTSHSLVAPLGLGDVWPRGGFDTFSPAWYMAVGTTLTITMMLDVVSPWSLTTLKLIKRAVQMYCVRGGCSKVQSQRQLNRLFVGSYIDIADRYARLINTAMVCLAFSSGIPILMPVACVCFGVAFWVDKFMFLRCFRTPPRFSAKIGRQASQTLVYGMILHSLLSIFMFNAGMLQSPLFANAQVWMEELIGKRNVQGDSWATQRLLDMARQHMVGPMGFAALIALITLLVICRSILSTAKRFCCGSSSEDEVAAPVRKRRRQVMPIDGHSIATISDSASWTDLRDGGRLQDLRSYDIADHPDYRDAFLRVVAKQNP
jgi:hypothetical protein